MKRFLVFIIAGFLCGCSHTVEPEPAKDSVSIIPATITVSNRGGEPEAVVTSSGAWRVADSGSDWVSISSRTGNDGDVVSFVVGQNTQEQERRAEFVFTSGEASATCVIVQAAAEPRIDEISVTPVSDEVGMDGGTSEVVVTSSGEWTLEGSYDWVTASASSGGDGATVRFTVAGNMAVEDRRAEYVFRCGEAEATFTLVNKGGVRTTLSLLSPSRVGVPYTGSSDLEALLDTNTDYRDLVVTVVSGSWLSHRMTLAGENGQGARVLFAAEENTTLQERTAVAKIETADRYNSVEITFTQGRRPQITVNKEQVMVGLEGGTVGFTVTSNVDYDILVDDADKAWITHTGKSEGQEILSVSASESFRMTTVRVADKATATVSVGVLVVQQGESLVNVAADMTENRAWPAWNNPAPVNNLSELTMEALVCLTKDKGYGKINTVMGIEGKFLIRLGDAGYNPDQLQVVYPSGMSGVSEMKLVAYPRLSELNRWYHIAVTYKNGRCTAYIDGAESGSNGNGATTVSLGVPHNEETGTSFDRCFWVGYSFLPERYFSGMLSEVRIWNRALSAEEIKAENHFYKVEPDADGLVAYWKFDDKSATTVKDHTSYGNDLKAQYNIKWTPVSLP